MKIWRKRLTDSINHEAVYRTAPATPGLLITQGPFWMFKLLSFYYIVHTPTCLFQIPLCGIWPVIYLCAWQLLYKYFNVASILKWPWLAIKYCHPIPANSSLFLSILTYFSPCPLSNVLGKVSAGLEKVSDCLSKVSDSLGKVFSGKCQMVLGRCQMISGRCKVFSGRCEMVLGRCEMALRRCQVVLRRC